MATQDCPACGHANLDDAERSEGCSLNLQAEPLRLRDVLPPDPAPLLPRAFKGPELPAEFPQEDAKEIEPCPEGFPTYWFWIAIVALAIGATGWAVLYFR